MKYLKFLLIAWLFPVFGYSQVNSTNYTEVFISKDTLHFKSDKLSGALEFTSSDSDQLFILDLIRNQVFKLDDQLNVSYSFGRSGKGPGEFTKASDIYFYNDKIFVMDLALMRISSFMSNGDFIKSFTVEERATDIIVSDGKVCTHTGGIVPPSGNQINCYDAESGDKIDSFSPPSSEIAGKFLSLSNLTFNTIQFQNDRIISLSHPVDPKIYVWDLNGKLISEFSIENEVFEKPSFPENFSPASGSLSDYTTATISSVFAYEDEIRVIYIENGTGIKYCYIYDYQGNQLHRKPIDFEKRYITYQSPAGELMSVSYTDNKDGLVLHRFKK